MALKKYFARHFRIIVLLVLSMLILLLAVASERKSEALPFGTYALSLDGSGDVKAVRGVFDFQNDSYLLSYSLGPGSYALSSNTELSAYVDGQAACELKRGVACPLKISSPSSLSISFNGSGMRPNGRFRLSFCNPAEVDLNFILGSEYHYVGLYSLLPREIHGEFIPEKNQLLLLTPPSLNGTSSQAEFVDFDLYVLNETSRQINEGVEWREDIIIVPLVMALFLLLISDVIDYAHDYLKKKVKR